MNLLKTNRTTEGQRKFWILLCSVACLGAIWFPYGFSMGGILEEWVVLWIGQKYGGRWSSFPGQPYGALFGVRPLTIFPVILSAWLSGDSFLGFHILLLLALAMKVLAGIAIGRFLFRNTAFALCFGLLFLVYPADTEQIALRIMHVNLANGLGLVATALFLKGYLSRKTLPRALFLAGSAVLFIFATLIYEFTVVFYALPIALLFMRFGFLATLKTLWMKRRSVLIWLAAPVLSLTYILLVMNFDSGTYQVAVAPEGVLHEVFHNSRFLLYSCFYRTFCEGWADSFAILFSELKNPLIFICFLLVLVSAVLILRKHGTFNGATKTLLLLRYQVIGFGLLVVGYLPVLTISSHTIISQRTFLYVVPGAVIVLTSFLFFFFRFSKPAVFTIVVGLVFSGLVSQNYQHFRYTEFYTQSTGPYLSYVAAAADASKRIHIVLDHSGYSTYLNGLYTAKVTYGPPVILHKPDDIFLLCKDLPLNGTTIFHRYSIQHGKVRVSAFNEEDKIFDEKDVDVITIPRTSLRPPAGQRLWDNMNTYSPSSSPFRDPRLNDHLYIFKADSMWGYSDFLRGDGWSDGMCQIKKFKHKNFIIPTANSANALVDLGQLQDTDYLLRLRCLETIPEQIRRGMTAGVNGEPIQLDFVGSKHTVIQSLIPKGKIKDGMNELSFTGVLPADGVYLTLQKFLLGPKEQLIQADGEEIPPALQTR